MRHVNGYIFLAYYDNDITYLFDRDRKGQNNFDNLENNHLTPYPTRREAVQGKKIFFKRKDPALKTVRIGRLEMEIADGGNEEEILSFMDKDSLVAIKINPDLETEELRGEFIEGRRVTDYIPGMWMVENGLIPFKTDTETSAFEKAYSSARQINRQGQCPATLATFKLELL